jgi:raffinose/stachyose/melibiose transport system permease protein
LKHVVNTVRPWQLALFLAPAVIVYSLFSALPLIQTLAQGFFSARRQRQVAFVGLENFRTILLDPDWSAGFWNAMANNAKFFGIHMLLQNPVGLLLATLFSLKGLRGARTYRTLIFLPTLLSVVIIGFIWQLILSPLWGVGEN